MRKMRKQETVVSTNVLVVLRLSIALCESPSLPSHLSIRLPALIMQMTLGTKNVAVKHVLKSKRTAVQITAAAKRRLFSIDLLYCCSRPNESRSVEHYLFIFNLFRKVKNENLWSNFIFFWTQNGEKLNRK